MVFETIAFADFATRAWTPSVAFGHAQACRTQRFGQRPLRLAGGEDAGERAALSRDRQPTALSRFSTVPLGLTLYQVSAILPFSSMRNAERMIPKYFLPYMLFSPHVP